MFLGEDVQSTSLESFLLEDGLESVRATGASEDSETDLSEPHSLKLCWSKNTLDPVETCEESGPNVPRRGVPEICPDIVISERHCVSTILNLSARPQSNRTKSLEFRGLIHSTLTVGSVQEGR